MSIIGRKISPSQYAKLLKFLLVISGIFLVFVPFFYKWLWEGNASFNEIKFRIMKVTGLSTVGSNLFPSLKLKLLAMMVEGVSVALLLIGCIYFFKLLDFYSKGEFFSKNVLGYYRKILWTAFLWTLYGPIKLTILSILTTINNPPGQRTLSVILGSEDLLHILIVGSLLVINLLMQEAFKLKQEQDLTV